MKRLRHLRRDGSVKPYDPGRDPVNRQLIELTKTYLALTPDRRQLALTYLALLLDQQK